MAELEQRLNRSSRNSSLPPSQDPPSAPPRPQQPMSRAQAGRSARPRGQEPAAASARAGGRGRRALAGALPGLRAVFIDGRARRRGHAAAPPGRGAAADRGQGDRASPAPAVLSRSAPPRPAPSFLPTFRARRSGRACRRRSSRSRCGTASPVATRPSSCASCSGPSSRPARSTRSSQRAGEALAEPHTRLQERDPLRRAVNIDETGWRPRGGKRTLWGALTGTGGGLPHRARPPRARGQDPARRASSPGSPAPTAGRPTTTSTRSDVSSAGRTCSATSPPTARGWPPRRSSARPALRSPARLFDGLGGVPAADGDRVRLLERIAPLQARTQSAARARGAQEHQDEVPPQVRQQPAQALAGALDLHPHRRRRADQQPRRTRPPRRRHLPQTLPRQPIRTRRAHHRTTALRLDHLPPPTALALRLPHRRPHRQHPRRPHPPTRLTTPGT